MRKLIDLLTSRLLILLVALMVLNVLWQVATRYVSNSPSSFTDELAGFLLIWVGMLGAAYATGQRMHLAIDLLPRRSSPAKQRVFNLVVNLLVAGFAVAVMVVGGARLVFITLTLNQVSSALGLPLGYVYAIVPVSGLLIAYYSILNLRHNPYQDQNSDLTN
jgi:TRAP-type C4-dicarboxylate transport system permease small subunit